MLTPATSTRQSLYAQTLNRMGWSMMIFIGLTNLTAGISSGVMLLRDEAVTTSAYFVLTVLYGILSPLSYIAPFFLTGLFFYVLSRKIRTEGLSLEVHVPRELPLLILAGVAILTAAAYVNSWFCSAIGYTMPEDMILTGSYDSPSVIIQYMTVAIAPAFAEEFLFRGVFYTNLRPYGRTQAILISSLLFALMHQNIGQLFYTFVGGVAMALMYELTGSIWCSIFFHLFNNQISVLSEFLYYGRYGEIANPYLTLLEAVILLLGMISLVVLIVYYKRRSVIQSNSRSSGIFGVRDTNAPISRREQPLSSKSVIKGLLTPGIIVFTSVTVVLMGFLWLIFALMNGGAI